MPNRVKVVAEMACSHEGDPALAKRIIDAAGRAGADAIQFQIFKAAELMVPQHPDRPKLDRVELLTTVWEQLADHVHTQFPAVEIVACVFGPGSVDVAERLCVGGYKLHASDRANPALLRRVAATGKHIGLSVGSSTLDEIQRALEWLSDAGNTSVSLMYGYQTFPTPAEEVNLAYMATLHRLFDLPIGYQDHSDADTSAAFWLPAAAIAMGATIVEKHLTHDRSLKGIDHEAALNPDEFARFVAMVRELDAAIGSPVPRALTQTQLKYRSFANKSLVATRDLNAGRVLEPDDLCPMRAEGLGLAPEAVDTVVGRRLVRGLRAYELLREDDLA